MAATTNAARPPPLVSAQQAAGTGRVLAGRQPNPPPDPRGVPGQKNCGGFNLAGLLPNRIFTLRCLVFRFPAPILFFLTPSLSRISPTCHSRDLASPRITHHCVAKPLWNTNLPLTVLAVLVAAPAGSPSRALAAAPVGQNTAVAIGALPLEHIATSPRRARIHLEKVQNGCQRVSRLGPSQFSHLEVSFAPAPRPYADALHVPAPPARHASGLWRHDVFRSPLTARRRYLLEGSTCRSPNRPTLSAFANLCRLS